MQLKLFITGTDTNIGKTYVSAGILSAFNQLGYSTLGIKPVASGCKRIHHSLYSEDTLTLQRSSSIALPHDTLTPFAYEPPIAPNIAAEQSLNRLSVDMMNLKLQPVFNVSSNIYVIEGCGGWLVPLNQLETMADFVVSNRLMVVMVVGIRLGCINHALLTYRSIQQDGAISMGWVANCIDPEMANKEENINTLKNWLPIPCLGVIEYGTSLMSMIDIAISLQSTYRQMKMPSSPHLSSAAINVPDH